MFEKFYVQSATLILLKPLIRCDGEIIAQSSKKQALKLSLFFCLDTILKFNNLEQAHTNTIYNIFEKNCQVRNVQENLSVSTNEMSA